MKIIGDMMLLLLSCRFEVDHEGNTVEMSKTEWSSLKCVRNIKVDVE